MRSLGLQCCCMVMIVTLKITRGVVCLPERGSRYTQVRGRPREVSPGGNHKEYPSPICQPLYIIMHGGANLYW